ncbi:MAG: MFS transporter [Spirochaetes bacterium RIFOXYC1_FULL_54_7]|nr:MAG: MFS transporter [Spirochaetes bacterium RIFOXYC1_FULL_54_7]
MGISLGWSSASVTLGYSVMMLVYALTAYLSGLILDRFGTRPVYGIAAILGGLGFGLTSRVDTHLAYLVSFGLLGGVATGMLWVSSTVSVRKWYVGKTYAGMWGLAFSGAPMAQFLLAQLLRPRLGAAQAKLDTAVASLLDASGGASDGAAVSAALFNTAVRTDPGVAPALASLDAAWRSQMLVLGLIVGATLAVAMVFARRSPDYYGIEPFGTVSPAAVSGRTTGSARPDSEHEWSIREAFSRYAIWGAIVVFLSSMMAEFLVWTQVVSFWTGDMGYSLAEAASVYALIGLVGIFGMPLMGRLADWLVQQVGNEPLGRKLMLVAGPVGGALACVLLLGSANRFMAYAACVVFALYWAVVPGGVVGYVGALYGRRALGRIWGLATLIVMGTGPFLGTFIGSSLRDSTGSYRYSMLFALGSFILSAVLATTLPRALPLASVLPSAGTPGIKQASAGKQG